jgi:hypothetical protein
MRITTAVIVALAVSGSVLSAQEPKPVPKDSMRVTVPGCTKGSVFTAAAKTEDQLGRADIPEGTRLRINAPKKLMAEIKAHEGQMIQITGLMKKGQYNETGIPVGGGVRVTPGSGGVSVGRPSPTVGSVNYVDIESWQLAPGDCPSR